MQNHVPRWEDLPPGEWLPNDEYGVHWYLADDGSHWYSADDGYHLWQEEQSQPVENSKPEKKNDTFDYDYEDFYDDEEDDGDYLSGSFKRRKSPLPAILMLLIIGGLGASGYFVYDYLTKEVAEPEFYGQIHWDYSATSFDGEEEINGLLFQQGKVTSFYHKFSDMCDDDPQIDESGYFCIRDAPVVNLRDRGDYYQACDPESITCLHFYIHEKGLTIYDPEWQNCADIVSGIEKPELVTDGNDGLEPTDEWKEEFNQIKYEIKSDRPYVCDESFDV